MSKKPAPPGKRGSVKREAFKVDEDGDDSTTSTTGPVAAPVVAASPAALGPNDEEIKRRQEAERRMERERQERLQYERDRLAEEEEHRRQAHAAQSMSDDVKRQREMAAAAEAEREREALRAAEVAARERAQKEELERRRREMLQQQQQQQQREEEEEEARKQAEIVAAAAAARERAEKQQQEIERAQADLAARHQAEKEELRLLKVQQQELERLQADQLRAKQEQEEEKRRQQQEAVDRERSRLIEEARRARDEAEARQRAEDEAEEAELRRQAEIERERVKAAKLAETQRLKDEEEAEIAEALKRAEEQRRKRQMFLSDMDSFSTQFVSQTQEKETALEDAQRKQDTLRANLAAIPAAPVDQPRVRSNHRVIDDADDDLRPLTIVEEPIPASPPPFKHHLQSGTTRNILVDASAVQSRQQNLAQLTNALFTDNDADSSDGAATPVATGPTIAAVIESTTVDGEELRMPTRIGGGDKAYRTKTTATATAASSTAVAGTAAASVTAGSRALAHHSSAGASASAVGGDEDDEEEGTGQLDSISNILTREERRTMTREEKANWRAKQVDLNTRRKDFHGAVTYMFDGIFSWQMYGSAEALDEFGNTYTEYLMRCQWGTSFENLQPWIVAHRYREFDKLDQDLKKRFPALENTMPRLPKKEFFWSMETQVVTKRRQALEDYMVKLVQSYPTLLRSDLMDVFLHIAERIKSIKMLLKVAPSLNMTKASSSSASAGGSAAGSSSSSQPPSSQSQQPPQRAEDVYEAAAESAGVLASVSMDGSDPLGVGQPVTTKRGGSSTVRGGGGPVVVVDDDEASRASKPNATKILYWTMDEADRAKDETHCRPLDEDGLGCVEEDIRNLYMMMKKTPAKEIVQRDSHVRRQLARINHRWPALRATSVVNMDVDFILIPRAMQAEEDYVRALNEFRNLDMLQGYNV